MHIFRDRGRIWRLFVLLNILVFLAFLFVEQVFIWNYRATLSESMRMLTQAGADQIFSDINRMWYELNLISGTLSRSEAMRAYVRADVRDEKVFQALRSTVYLTQLAADNIDSIIVTDFQNIQLFAYGPVDNEVLTSAKRAISNGLVIKNPVHLQFMEGENRLAYCINCTDSTVDGSTLYTIIIYNLNQIRDAFKTVGSDYGVNMVLLDGNNEPIIESMSLEGEQRADAMEKIRLGTLSENEMFIQMRNFSLLRWHLTAFVSDYELANRMTTIERFAWVMNIFMILILCAFILMLGKHINQPIRQILDFMRSQAAQHASRDHLELKNKNELNEIAKGLNDMLDKQRRMTEENLRSKERIYQIELTKKQSEIAALTHQINPHFLYNTLDCMHGMAVAGGAKGLEEIITAMAHIFRYATRAKSCVSIEEEIRSIAHYMAIVRIRHGGRIEAVFDMDESVQALHIPKMLLQPIVENAVMHGLEAVNRKGLLRIIVRREEDYLYLIVRDNGHGMKKEELQNLLVRINSMDDNAEERFDHIGLANIHRRIRLLYGETCGLDIESGEDTGTEVTLRILAVLPSQRAKSEGVAS